MSLEPRPIATHDQFQPVIGDTKKVKPTRNYLMLAASAMLTAGAVASGPALAFSVDAEANALVTDDAGDSLIFPFYSTSVGDNILAGEGGPVGGVTSARSSFSVTNTSPTQSLVVKIRFREQFTSQEVFDFLVFLSPSDKFDFRVKQDANPDGTPNGLPYLIWDKVYDGGNLLVGASENSCLAPANLHNTVQPSVPGSNNRFRVPDKPIPQVQLLMDTGMTKAEAEAVALSVGHVEVIAMADITNAFIPPSVDDSFLIGLAQAITHDPNTGLPVNCALAQTAFSRLLYVRAIEDAADAPNVLIGRELVSVPAIGVEAGTNAIPIKNTFLDPMLSAQFNEQCDNEPGCIPVFAWDTDAASHPHFGDSPFIAGVEAQLTANALQNDWSRTESTGVGVDWIVSFPTKYVYLDTCNPLAEWAWCYSNAVLSSAPWDSVGPTEKPIALGCLDTNLGVWDIDEYFDGNVSPTPNPPLCAEVNVLTIHEKDTTPPSSFIQADVLRQAFTFDDNLFDPDERLRGWAELIFGWFNVPARPISIGCTECQPYLPGAAVAGLAFTVRATTDPTINTGSLTELSRKVDEPL